jgi:hypothetical protein
MREVRTSVIAGKTVRGSTIEAINSAIPPFFQKPGDFLVFVLFSVWCPWS